MSIMLRRPMSLVLRNNKGIGALAANHVSQKQLLYIEQMNLMV